MINNDEKARYIPLVCVRLITSSNHLSISCFSIISSEWDTRGEHSLYQGRCRHQVLELEIEDSLESLDAQRSQLRKFVEDPAEVVRLPLSVRVVRHVITKRVDNLVL